MYSQNNNMNNNNNNKSKEKDNDNDTNNDKENNNGITEFQINIYRPHIKSISTATRIRNPPTIKPTTTTIK